MDNEYWCPGCQTAFEHPRAIWKRQPRCPRCGQAQRARRLAES